ncbi:chaplin family protein [Streptomyces sp. Li-HN-5-11]
MQVPVDIPINECGRSANFTIALNPAIGRGRPWTSISVPRPVFPVLQAGR